MPRPALDGGSRGFFYEDRHPKKCVGYMVRIADIHQQAIQSLCNPDQKKRGGISSAMELHWQQDFSSFPDM
jgi:hypothetical protein